MPYTYASCELFCALSAMAFMVVGSTSSDVNPDIIAGAGAMAATCITVIEARKKDRSLGHTISVFIGSSFVGTFTPGLVVFYWWPTKMHALPWQAWAAGGFFSGLCGWAAVLAVPKIFISIKDAFVEGVKNKFNGVSNKNQN